MSTILGYLMLPWVFYPLCGTIIGFVYNAVEDDKDFDEAPLWWIAIIVACCLYRFDSFRAYAFTWGGALSLVAAYVGAGIGVALWKWVIALSDFKARVALWMAQRTPDYVQKVIPVNQAKDMSSDLYDGSPYHAVKVVFGETVTYVLDHKQFPLVTWAVYWPFFLFSVALDPIARLVRRILSALKGVLDTLAKRFSVS